MNSNDQQTLSQAARHEKRAVDTVEQVISYAHEETKYDGHGKADHTGALEKTDSQEIALVRKIDGRLMVFDIRTSPSDQLSNNFSADFIHNVLSCTRQSNAQQNYISNDFA